MRKLLGISAVALIVMLSGCSPDTNAAYEKCVQTLMLPVDMRDDVSTQEYADAVVDVAEVCSGAAEADPEAFIESWTND